MANFKIKIPEFLEIKGEIQATGEGADEKQVFGTFPDARSALLTDLDMLLARIRAERRRTLHLSLREVMKAFTP